MKTLTTRLTINPEYEKLRSFVRDVPEKFDQLGTLIYDRRNKVRRVEVDGSVVIIKRYKVPLWFQRVDYTFLRPSKALRAYRYAFRLLEMGIDTPKPIACIEVHRHGLFLQGYFLSTECTDESMKVLYGDDPQGELRMEFAAHLVMMHEKGFLHGDLNLSNIYFHEKAPNRFHFTVIDTNRSRFVKKPTKAQCLQNLMRISRDRALTTDIVERYAWLRCWDEEKSVRTVMRAIDKYERERRRRTMRENLLRINKK